MCKEIVVPCRFIPPILLTQRGPHAEEPPAWLLRDSGSSHSQSVSVTRVGMHQSLWGSAGSSSFSLPLVLGKLLNHLGAQFLRL